MDTLATRTGLQRLSHESLLAIKKSPARPDTKLDAIIVPAARPAKCLATAIDRAREADCELVVLCSRETHPRDVLRRFHSRGFSKGTAVEIPGPYSQHLLKFETSNWVKTETGQSLCGYRKSDLSTKRNIGLLMARMLGWKRIFFLDDDIRGITHSDIMHTTSLLDVEDRWYRSAGIRVKDFPDNSVVCHARRKVGEAQEVFVSGSVLAVNCKSDLSFFPDIYNEDWLFFYNDVGERRMASPDLHVTKMQMRYKPFANPDRAAHEEFGDVIAEGLYSLLHTDRGCKFATHDYWQQFKNHRMRILDGLIDHVCLAKSQDWNQVAQSLKKARETLSGIDPAVCCTYVESWQRDLGAWRKRLADIQPVTTASEALRELGLRPL